MGNDIVISVQNVGLRYPSGHGLSFWLHDGYWALKDVSFDLHHGETLGIIGRNGAGKSTLLRLLCGIYSPDRGAIVSTTSSVSLIALQLGFNRLFSGRENAVLSGMLMGRSRQFMWSAVQEIREFAELGEHFDMPLYTYSSGMRARLGVAVAIFAAADVLLLDEVLGVGDITFQKKSSQTIRSLIRSERSVVLISHNLTTIKDLCDRVVWIENGISCMEGPPRSSRHGLRDGHGEMSGGPLSRRGT